MYFVRDVSNCLLAIILLGGMIWWEFFRRHPTLREIRLATIQGPLFLQQWISACPGIAVWISGNKFSYHYTEHKEGRTMISTLTVKPRKGFRKEPKPVLLAVFNDDQVEHWALADGEQRQSADFAEWYALHAILQTIQNIAALEHIGAAAAETAYQNVR